MDGDPANFNSKLLKPFAKFFLSKEQRMRKIEDETEKEILMLIDEGEEKGVIEESQREMITNIFEFDDILTKYKEQLKWTEKFLSFLLLMMVMHRF